MRNLIVLVVGTALLCTGLVLADPVATPAGITAQQAQAKAAEAKTPAAVAAQARSAVKPEAIPSVTAVPKPGQQVMKPAAKEVTPITVRNAKSAPAGGRDYYYVKDAPFDGDYLSTCGSGDNCGLRSTEDNTYEIHIPYAGIWAFDLCNSSFDTYILLGTSFCSSDLGQNDDYCGLNSYMQVAIGAGTVYLDVEGYSSCGTYQVRCYEVVMPTGACCVSQVCVETDTQLACQGLGGHWFQGQTCPEFTCPIAPPNDTCQDAWPVALPGTVVYNGDNTLAVEDCSYLSGGVYREVWFVLNLSETTDVSIRYCGTSPAFYNAYIVMDPYCPCSGAWIYSSSYENTSCGDGNWTLLWNGLAAGTYYWPLLTDSAGGYAEGPYTVTFHGGPPTGACCVRMRCIDDETYSDCREQGGWLWWEGADCSWVGCVDVTPLLCLLPNGTFSQEPGEPPDPSWAYTSGIDPNGAFEYTCFEDFWALAPIASIHWWGLSLQYSNGWCPCDPTGLAFEIKFYADAGGAPDVDNPTCQYLVNPTIIDTGYDFYGVYFWYRFCVDTLTPCCFMSDGWVSIKSVTSPNGCVFLWLNSPEGNCNALQLPAGGPFIYLHTNLSICMGTGDCPVPYGACCIDATGECTDAVSVLDCMAVHGRFAADTLCADLHPACGEITGACCHPDGTCDVIPQHNCPDLWLGPNTHCAACPCVVICPPGASQEPEACGDDTDGGCDSMVPVFAPITCGQTVCGTSWANYSLRDADWYQLTTPDAFIYDWSIEAEFPVLIFIIRGAGPDNCSGYTVLTYATAGECTPLWVSSGPVEGGTYWFWVGPSEWSDLPCPLDYVATLDCTPWTPPTGACCVDGVCAATNIHVECTGMGGQWYIDETCPEFVCPETCADFLVTAPGEWRGSTCGWGNDCALRWTDDVEYEVVIPNDGMWVFSLCGSAYDTYEYLGTDCCTLNLGGNDDYCGPQSEITVNVAAGHYFVDIEGYSGCGDYVLSVYERVRCDPACPPGATEEPEPCGEDTDGGCYATPPVFAPITCDQTVCGTAWANYNIRDTDWYQIMIEDSTTFTWSACAEFPMLLCIMQSAGPDDCSSFTVLTYGYGDAHIRTSVSASVGAGTYWFWIGPSGCMDLPCPLNYVATLEADPNVCMCGDLNHDGTVNVDDYWMFLDAFGSCVGDPGWNPEADFDGQDCITLVDYQYWLQCYHDANGKSFTPPPVKTTPEVTGSAVEQAHRKDAP